MYKNPIYFYVLNFPRFGSKTDVPSLGRHLLCSIYRELITGKRLPVLQQIVTFWQDSLPIALLCVRKLCVPYLHRGPLHTAGQKQDQEFSILLMYLCHHGETLHKTKKKTVSNRSVLMHRSTIGVYFRDITKCILTTSKTLRVGIRK